MCIISILFLFSHLFLCIPLPHTGCSINVGGREGGRKEGRKEEEKENEGGREGRRHPFGGHVPSSCHSALI